MSPLDEVKGRYLRLYLVNFPIIFAFKFIVLSFEIVNLEGILVLLLTLLKFIGLILDNTYFIHQFY